MTAAMILSSPQSDIPKDGPSSIELYSKGYIGPEEVGADFSATWSVGDRRGGGAERRGEERGEFVGEVVGELCLEL